MRRYRIKRVKNASPPPMPRAGPYLPSMAGFLDFNQYGTQLKRTSPVRKSSKSPGREILNQILRNYNAVTTLPNLSPRKSPKKRKRTSSPLRKSPPKRSPTLANRRMYPRPPSPRHYTATPLRFPIRLPAR